MVYLLLCLRDNPSRVIGIMNFSQISRAAFQACYLGYKIDKDEQGKGLMTEAVRLGVAYMFEERKLHRIMANYMPRNAKSARVLKKAGFRIDGRAKAYLLINGKWEDHVLTSLVNSNWRGEGK
jgi:ribosomal-protein-alanine N-acetyltransferase